MCVSGCGRDWIPDVRFLAAASTELVEARRWYEEVGLDVAVRFVQSLNDAVEQIQRFPAIGKPQGAHVRALLIRGFPYAIVYREHDGELQVIAVAHTSRRPGFWRTRIQ